ncbi:DUF4838 domain-containing protein [Paenibacillus contaminans]|uniref:CBM-cenC domain-containing protein n=1 Tax=Paenibacillus contaminans TaxID=450362 RepID=A0A329LXG8_9BACL|nr:DUF4838 domain-containing protein [Paenibacillus contaminans]RAV11900.1 hypothetical protein DQG23_35565 [Paenibacillus contaminans]
MSYTRDPNRDIDYNLISFWGYDDSLGTGKLWIDDVATKKTSRLLRKREAIVLKKKALLWLLILLIALTPLFGSGQTANAGQAVPETGQAELADALTIAGNSQAQAGIILSTTGTDLEALAAAELQNTIRQISGAELPIARADLSKDGVSASLETDTLRITKSGEYAFSIKVTNNSVSAAQVSFLQTDQGSLRVGPLNPINLAPWQTASVSAVISVLAQTIDGTYQVEMKTLANGEELELLTLNVQLDRNIVVNSGFDADLAGWWASTGVATRDVTEKHSGASSMRITVPASGYTYARTDQKLYLEPGREYVLKAWMKGSRAGRITMEFRSLKNNSDITNGSTKLRVEIGADWTYVEIPYTRNPNLDFDYNWIAVWAYNDAIGTNTLWVDDVTISPANTAEELGNEPAVNTPANVEAPESGAEHTRIILATPESYPELSTLFADDLAFLENSDGFAVRQSGNTIYIFGSEPRGVLNGVYDFLEKNAGVLWTRASDVGTIYEPRPTIQAVQTDYREKSPFAIRGWHTPGVGANGEFHTDARTNQMLARNKLNAKFAEFGNLSYWAGHESIGLKAVNLGHSLSYWLPNQEFFSSHPEYYNWENGQYVPVTGATQINFYHPDIPSIIAGKVKTFYQTYGTEYIGIGINDNHSFTQSAESKLPFTTPGGLVVQPDDPAYKSTVFFTFLNKVAAEVKQTNPEVKIVSYAYFFTEVPPKVELEDNIVIVMAPAGEDERIPINTENQQSNNYKYKQMLEEWVKLTKNIVMYNYYGCCYAKSYERPLAEKVQADVQYYRELGILGMLPEGIVDAKSEAWGVNALQFWLFEKLFWNPDADIEALTNEFVHKAYGAAAEPMKRYYNLIKQGWNYDQQPINWYSNESQLIGQYIVQAGIQEAAAQELNEAWELADERAKARIEPIRSTFMEMTFKYGGRQQVTGNAVKTSATQEEIVSALDFSQGPWSVAEPITAFLKMGTNQTPSVETKVYLLWDDEHLYVGYENFDNDMNGRIISQDAPGSWWRSGADDSAETHLSDGKGGTTYAYFTNPLGVKFTYKTGPKLAPEAEFTAGATTLGDRWNVIQAIPFASFGVDPQTDDKFKALFLRNYHGQTAWYSWGGGAVWSPADQSVVHLVTPVYAIAEIGDQTAAQLRAGYEPGTQETKVIQVGNSGTAALSGLTVAVSGEHAQDFIWTQPETATLGIGESASFTVKVRRQEPTPRR